MTVPFHTVDTEFTGEAVGSAPGHAKVRGTPELAGLVLELSQLRSTPGITLVSNAESCPMTTMTQTQTPSWYTYLRNIYFGNLSPINILLNINIKTYWYTSYKTQSAVLYYFIPNIVVKSH